MFSSDIIPPVKILVAITGATGALYAQRLLDNLNPQEHVWKALRKHLAKVAGQYTFKETIDRACRFLRTETFDFAFI